MLFNGLSQSEKVILFKYIKTIFRLYIDRLCDHLIFQLNTVILSAGVDNTAVFTSAELQYIGTFTNDTANRITAMDTNIANITQDLAAADANYQAALAGTDDNLKASTLVIRDDTQSRLDTARSDKIIEENYVAIASAIINGENSVTPIISDQMHINRDYLRILDQNNLDSLRNRDIDISLLSTISDGEIKTLYELQILQLFERDQSGEINALTTQIDTLQTLNTALEQHKNVVDQKLKLINTLKTRSMTGGNNSNNTITNFIKNLNDFYNQYKSLNKYYKYKTKYLSLK